MEAYRVNIQGLSNKVHHFDFDLNDAFFSKYGHDLITEGDLNAKVSLDKRETLIEVKFEISGTVELVCDRSLEKFDYPIEIDRPIIYKFGHEEAEVSEDVMMITAATESIELGQLMFEFVSLSVPMKKLHPRFEKDADREGIVYSSGDTNEKDETDPRWDILKKMNKN